MAVADSSYYPTYGQAFRLYGKIVNVTTGNPIPTLTALACTISKDGGAFSATGVTVTETPAASGYIAIDINATGMTANSVVVEATASNGSAVKFTAFLQPVVLTESAGHWRSQAVNRLEQSNVQMSAFMTNRHTVALALESVYARDDVTLLFSSSISGIASASSTQTRNKLA